jgi:hypothetical protein
MRVLLLVFVAGCCQSYKKPTSTGTQCADPDPITGTTTLTWDNFGHDFMCHYCTNCHDSSLPLSKRNGAPLFHDFDYLDGAMEVPDHIDMQAGESMLVHNNAMPGGGTCGQCPTKPGGPLDRECLIPTAEERQQLAQWLACQRLRTAENAAPTADQTHSDHCASYSGPR